LQKTVTAELHQLAKVRLARLRPDPWGILAAIQRRKAWWIITASGFFSTAPAPTQPETFLKEYS